MTDSEWIEAERKGLRVYPDANRVSAPRTKWQRFLIWLNV
jgi:hypothetical protein